MHYPANGDSYEYKKEFWAKLDAKCPPNKTN
jgi:hypothetical protein